MASCGQPARKAEPPVGEVTENRASAGIARQPQLLIEANGLVLRDATGARRTIAFGSPASEALAAARQMYGAPLDSATLEECGAGPLQVSRFAGLTVAAQDGKFAGWSTDGRYRPPLPATERGIGIGSSRAALEKAYAIEVFDSSLGNEFIADGLAGLTDAPGKAGKITHLWAGATCIMR